LRVAEVIGRKNEFARKTAEPEQEMATVKAEVVLFRIGSSSCDTTVPTKPTHRLRMAVGNLNAAFAVPEIKITFRFMGAISAFIASFTVSSYADRLNRLM
jgi:hypothetical protein